VVCAGIELWQVLGALGVGMDFEPLRHAAQALLRGESVFGDPLFVYPPTAALLLLPTAIGGEMVAFACWVIIGAAGLGLAGWLVCWTAVPRHRPYVAGLALLTLLGGLVAHRSLFLGNMSEVLVPLAVGVLLAFQRGRWTLGCALLALSLLIKPLLAPLLLVPVLHGRRRELARTMLPAGILLVVAILAVPGGRHFPEVLRYCLAGTNLHGGNAVNNLSLRGWAEGQHAPPALGVVASVLVVLVVTARIAGAWRAGGRPSPVWLGNVLLLGVFLAGAISEVHFLLVTIATTLLYLAGQHRPPRDWLMFLPGLALLGLPSAYPALLLGPGDDGQSWLVCGELFLFLALVLTTTQDRAPQPLAPLVEPPMLSAAVA